MVLPFFPIRSSFWCQKADEIDTDSIFVYKSCRYKSTPKGVKSFFRNSDNSLIILQPEDWTATIVYKEVLRPLTDIHIEILNLFIEVLLISPVSNL